MRFYKRDPDAALSGMAELTLQERGAYNTIIDLLYSRDGQVPDDDHMIRRVMGCHGNEWRAVKAKLIAKGKIWVEDGFLKANRVDDVLEEAAAFSEKQRKRVGKRWETARKRLGNVAETGGKTPANSEKSQQKQERVDTIADHTNTPIANSSVASATGGKPPERPLVEIVFGPGLRLLTSNGVVEKQARSLLGKWRNQYGDESLLAALGKAQREGALDPVGFVTGCLKAGGNRKGKADDRFARKMEMAKRASERVEGEPGVDNGDSRSDSFPLLPARAAGRG